MRLFFLSCRPFRLMYAQSRLVTSVLGTALSPITSLSAALGCIGFMNAALGFLPDFFLAMRSPLAKRSRALTSVPRNPALGSVLRVSLLSSGRALARREDFLERGQEAIHLLGRADRHAQMLEHRRERTADQHALLPELLDDRLHLPADGHHEEVGLGRNH